MKEEEKDKKDEKKEEEGNSKDQELGEDNKKHKKSKRWLWVSAGVLACVIVVYFVAGQYYNKRFFQNVTINGRDVSGMTAEQVRQEIRDEAQTYTLHIHTRGDSEETISGLDFDLHLQYGDALLEVLNEQQTWKWGLHFFVHTAHEIPVLSEYDESALKKLISKLACADTRKMEAPKDAYLTYDEEEGLHIVPEEKGNKITVKDLREQIILAIQNAETEISLEELGLYAEPKITQDDEELVAKYNLWKRHLDTKIVYHFDDIIETVDESVFRDWMSEEEDGSIAFDHEKIKEYVRGMARRYNTAYASKTLETSYGETVIISAGPYGWLVNQTEETEALETALLNCESQDREPIYHQTAASHTGPDYGNTYVEINLSAQHLFFYKEGELLVESDFVSGNESMGWATPAGAFPLTYKEKDATLRGPGYVTPVSYWMPFNGDIGMHDSSWRNSYGKNIYKNNGSHGCINLPPSVAKTIYENIEKGIPVLCYYLSGTEYISHEPKVEQVPEIIEPENPEFPENGIITPNDTTTPNIDVPDNTIVPDVTIPDNTIVPDVTIPDNTIVPDMTIPDNTIASDVIITDDTIVPDTVIPDDTNNQGTDISNVEIIDGMS